jgi:hypothetical protein
MKAGIYEASLQPAGGVGEYQRGDLMRLEGAEDWADYADAIAGGDHEQADAPGAIQGEVLVVDDVEQPCESRIYRMGDGDAATYSIVYLIGAPTV